MKKQTLNFSLLAIFTIALLLITSCKGEKKTPDKENTNTTVEKTVENKVKDFTPRSFNYNAPKPVNGKLKGVVELGASGFNWFLVNMDKSKNWELKDAKYGDGDNGIFENKATVSSVRSKLQEYIKSLLKTGVLGKDVHFVVSSGAKKEDVTQRVIKALEDLGYIVNTVTPEEEGKFALASVLPDSYKNNSFVVDMGSSNTKISFYDDGIVKGLETYGSKYYKKSIDPEIVFKDVKEKSSEIPDNKRKYCFIIGGVPFSFAKEVRQNKERYTVLKSPSFYKSSKDKIIAGKNIYQAIIDETNTQTYIFDWNSNFTIGFLKSLN